MVDRKHRYLAIGGLFVDGFLLQAEVQTETSTRYLIKSNCINIYKNRGTATGAEMNPRKYYAL
jgi:hypothetical protein